MIIISSPASFLVLSTFKYVENTLIFLINAMNNLTKLKSLKILKQKIFVNYNLRELNLIQKFKIINQIKNKGKLQFCDVYCGSNVINWRKKL